LVNSSTIVVHRLQQGMMSCGSLLYRIHGDKTSGTIITLLGRTHTEVAKSSTIMQHLLNSSATLQFDLRKR
jgi:hypothetical protein